MQLIMLISLALAGADATAANSKDPQSSLAVRAQRTYDTQEKWALGEYNQAVKVAKAQFDKTMKEGQSEYLNQMKAAFDVALNNKDLEEANKIDAAIKTIKPSKLADVASRLSMTNGSYHVRLLVSNGDKYQLVVVVKDGLQAEAKFIGKHGDVHNHKRLNWRQLTPQKDGRLKLVVPNWGYELWSPLPDNRWLLERWEKDLYHIGVAEYKSR